MSEAKVKIRSLKSLMHNAVKISGPIRIVACYDSSAKPVVGIFDPTSDLEEITNCYREANGVIAFIRDDSMYAVPACTAVRKIMEDNGFVKDLYMSVPFQWGTFPKQYAIRWNKLREWQEEQLEDGDYPANSTIIHARALA